VPVGRHNQSLAVTACRGGESCATRAVTFCAGDAATVATVECAEIGDRPVQEKAMAATYEFTGGYPTPETIRKA